VNKIFLGTIGRGKKKEKKKVDIFISESFVEFFYKKDVRLFFF